MGLGEQQMRSWVRQWEVACLKLLQGVWMRVLSAQSGLAPWEALHSATCMSETAASAPFCRTRPETETGPILLHAVKAEWQLHLSVQNILHAKHLSHGFTSVPNYVSDSKVQHRLMWSYINNKSQMRLVIQTHCPDGAARYVVLTSFRLVRGQVLRGNVLQLIIGVPGLVAARDVAQPMTTG